MTESSSKNSLNPAKSAASAKRSPKEIAERYFAANRLSPAEIEWLRQKAHEQTYNSMKARGKEHLIID